MKLTVLVDNNTYIDQYYYGEPGVSYYLEDEKETVLLDTGYSEVFLKNAKALGKDMEKISAVVLSHGHNDHTWGLPYLMKEDFMKSGKRKIPLLANPRVFRDILYENDHIGANITKEEAEAFFDLKLTERPAKASKNITFLGKIEQSNTFEAPRAIGKTIKNSVLKDDFVEDDTALAYRTEKGLYIITGCSHSGICNIIEQAKRVCDEERIRGIIGGLHMFTLSERLDKTIAYFIKNGIRELYPCHCTSFAVKAEIHKHIPVREVGVGLVLEW